MKDKCFDAGTIQAFLDGELASELLEQVARHVALCDDCAQLLHEAEEESAFAFEILGQEFDALVPTERIRASVFQAISNYEKPKVSLWQRLIGLASSFSNPTVASFASILIVFAIFAAVLSFRNQSEPIPTPDVADNSNPKVENINSTPAPTPAMVEPTTGTPPVSNGKADRVVYKSESKVKDQKSKIEDQKSSDDAPRVIKTVFVDGEETYLKTIATLEDTVKGKKDTVLRASSRVAYERDMAVINDSIKKMKAEVRKNPKNEAAKQILRNSYQNTIELLNSLSERSDMMASLD